ncbi:MAG: pyridoxal phosphate-dependent aminotransferase [Planctomycetes bacterium]|nr:pyridoxal phosphate-dependent aminotransferase [Planctomycetota bacterium]
MGYDFTTLVDRSHTGSVKWDAMRQRDPQVPPGIVPLSVGDMEFKSPPELVTGLTEYLDRSVLGYTAPTEGYRQAVCDWFRRRHDWEIREEWLVTIDGVVPALYTAVTAFTAPGDGVIFFPPIYPPIFEAIHDTGRTPVPVPLRLDDDGYRMDVAALAAAAGAAKMVLLCSPHNPVGRVWRREELERLGAVCRQHDLLVVSDEIHMDFTTPGHRHTVYSAVDPAFADTAIICTAPSKTFNLAGLQTSNIVISDHRLRKRFRQELARSGRHGPNQLGLEACRLAYSRCEPWLEELLAVLETNTETVDRFLQEHFPTVRRHDREGTYFLWLDFRPWGLGDRELERFMVERARLFLNEGYTFGAGGSGFERINLACPTWVLTEAMNRLHHAADGSCTGLPSSPPSHPETHG